jgi:hypothetical protein
LQQQQKEAQAEGFDKITELLIFDLLKLSSFIFRKLNLA